MINYLFLVQIALLWAVPAQLNQWHEYAAANVKFWIPEDWKQSTDGEIEPTYIMEFSSPDEGVVISFSVMAAQDLEASLLELEQTLGNQLENIEMLSEPEMIDLNGVEGVMTEIKGMMGEQAMQMGVFVLDTNGQVLLILGLAQEKAMQKYSGTIDKIMKSIELLDS